MNFSAKPRSVAPAPTGRHPQTMRAVVFRENGPPSKLQLVTDHPVPERKQGEVLVQVHATSVNKIDCKVRRGDIPLLLKPQAVRPKVPGGDVAGVVLQAESGSAVQPGARVALLSDAYLWNKPYGSYAEYMAAPEGQVAVVPEGVSFEQAAALPMAALTAMQALDPLNLKRYQRVLIHAGAGGVGSTAIQIAKARGLHITTTCSSKNIPFVREVLGADVAIDYERERFEEVCRDRPFDCILDLVGGEYEPRSKAVLKKWGTYISVLANVDLWATAKGLAWDIGPGPRYRVVLVQPNKDQLQEALKLVQEGKLQPAIDRVLPLEKAREAHEYVEQGHARGKVVLTVQGQTS